MRLRSRRSCRLLLLAICCLASPLYALGDTLILASEASRSSSAVDSILTGIREASADIDVLFIDPSQTQESIDKVEGTYEAVLLLGSDLVNINLREPDGIPVLAGAYHGILKSPKTLARISLNLDPRFVLEEVEKTGPTVSRVWSSVSPSTRNSPELRTLHKVDGLQVRISVDDGERASARAWFDAVRSNRQGTDMLWILDDQYLDESGTYRFLMESAWRNDLLVVSSIPNYANRGVAIGFIPNLRAYGELLMDTMDKMVNSSEYSPPSLLDGHTVQRVFNKRTLQHIGRSLPDDLDRLRFEDIIVE